MFIYVGMEIERLTKMKMMKKIINIKRNWIIFVAVLAGAAGGYLYWFYIGCNSGTCPITSNWHTNTMYGMLIGYLAGDYAKGLFYKKSKKEVST